MSEKELLEMRERRESGFYMDLDIDSIDYRSTTTVARSQDHISSIVNLNVLRIEENHIFPFFCLHILYVITYL